MSVRPNSQACQEFHAPKQDHFDWALAQHCVSTVASHFSRLGQHTIRYLQLWTKTEGLMY